MGCLIVVYIPTGRVSVEGIAKVLDHLESKGMHGVALLTYNFCHAVTVSRPSCILAGFNIL
jgi:hypothetical protein